MTIHTLKSVHIFNKFQHVKCISKSQTYLYHNIKLVLFHLISMADDKTLALRLYFPSKNIILCALSSEQTRTDLHILLQGNTVKKHSGFLYDKDTEWELG